MAAIELMGSLLLGLVGLGGAEIALHRRRLFRIPHRVHVSGTRGKSSVTRLLAAGFREAGLRTTAKTTGTLARLILPDAREIPVFRPAGANIIEQTRIVAAAAELKTEVLVAECMALQPELHWLSESKFIRATHGVITNARADHLDVMGPGERDVALCLAGMIPVKGVLFTGERRYLDVLEKAAADRGTRVVATTEEDVAAITEHDMNGFRFTEHAENVALSLKILESFDVSRDVALRGMWRAEPDPGALTEHELMFFGRRIIFVNGFAANDPESTEKIYRMACERHPDVEKKVIVFNLRADRASRTVQLAYHAQFWRDADEIVLVGSGSYLFAKMASKSGFDGARFVYADDDRVEEVFESILETCGRSTLVIGMANIGGLGLTLTRYFRNRTLPRGLS